MTVDLVLVVVAGAVLAIGLVSRWLQGHGLSAPLVAVVAGAALGPALLGVVQPDAIGAQPRVLEELARITLAVSLVATGLQITREDLRRTRGRVGMLLTAGLVGSWIVTSLGAHLLLGLALGPALVLGAVLTPTDPVVASSLVEGPQAAEHLPRSVRRTLQLESGANDGLALVFVLVGLAVALTPETPGEAVVTALGEVALAVAGGIVIGALAGRLVVLLDDHEDVASGFLLVSAAATGLLTLGAVHGLGGTGVLASFVAGVTFSLVVGERFAEHLSEVQSGLERLLIVPAFLLLGALLPFEGWLALGPAGIAFAAWVLLLRRPPVAVLALLPVRPPRAEQAFLAWFGPLGVAAVYYLAFVQREGVPDADRLFAAATLAITASLVAHAVTATPAVRHFPKEDA